jgi:hypothetical protein
MQTNLNSSFLLFVLCCVLCVVRNSQPKSSLCRRIQHLDEWSTTSSSACPFFVCRQTLLLVSPHYHDNNTLLLPKETASAAEEEEEEKLLFLLFSCREKRGRETAASAPDGWMKKNGVEESNKRE